MVTYRKFSKVSLQSTILYDLLSCFFMFYPADMLACAQNDHKTEKKNSELYEELKNDLKFRLWVGICILSILSKIIVSSGLNLSMEPKNQHFSV